MVEATGGGAWRPTATRHRGFPALHTTYDQTTGLLRKRTIEEEEALSLEKIGISTGSLAGRVR